MYEWMIEMVEVPRIVYYLLCMLIFAAAIERMED